MCLEMKDSMDESENTESPTLIIGLGNIVFTLFSDPLF